MRSVDPEAGPRGLTRRGLLGAAAALAAGAGLVPRPATAAPDPGPYGPFKMGLQSYSLRGYLAGGKPDGTKALAVTRDLGVHYWEVYPAHFPATTDPAKIAAARTQAAGSGVELAGYGVIPFTKDHDANRAGFEFAKAMGFAYLSCDPSPDSFVSLDKLVAEYDIPVGIHNHGPGHRYDTIDAIAAAIKGHDERIGCCVDTGHFLRSREDPVRAVRVFGPRVYGVHLKDVKGAETFTVLGGGDLRTADLLKALAGLKYRYCLALEYEERPDDPEADIRACLAEVRKAVAALG